MVGEETRARKDTSEDTALVQVTFVDGLVTVVGGSRKGEEEIDAKKENIQE